MSEWQPIESAPRGGASFLAYEEGAYYRAYFLPASEEESIVGAVCKQPVVYSPEPTHWMPLPEPPERDARVVHFSK